MPRRSMLSMLHRGNISEVIFGHGRGRRARRRLPLKLAALLGLLLFLGAGAEGSHELIRRSAPSLARALADWTWGAATDEPGGRAAAAYVYHCHMAVYKRTQGHAFYDVEYGCLRQL